MLLFSGSVVSDYLWPHELQHARLPCSSPSLRVCSNSYPLSLWCHATSSSSVVPFSCLQSLPASGSLLVSQLLPSGGQCIGDSLSASVLPMKIQDWFPLGLTVLISLQSKGLSTIFFQYHSSKASILRCSSFLQFSSVQFSHSVGSNSLQPHESQHAGVLVIHQLPEFTQTHIHRVRDAIQPSHPLSSPSPPAHNPSQHQSLL